MLPIGKGRGELWKGDTFLCKVDYEISPPLPYVIEPETQYVKLAVHDYAAEELTREAGLILMLADDSRHSLPHPTHFADDDRYLECFVDADA
jgi:hypothetical protein